MIQAPLRQISETVSNAADIRSKPGYFYDRYETYFAPFADSPIAMIELGVHAGDSLKVFSTYFPRGSVLGVDIADPRLDLSQFPNATFELGDQRNGDQLRDFSARYAPKGWDIIIDDASHYGSWSRLTFEALYPMLRPGGLYVVEDWQTGYWDDWPDGQRYQDIGVIVPDGHIPPRVPSHDTGMVGFVKSLIDEVVDKPVGARGSHIGHPRKFQWMHVNDAFVILKK